MAQINSCLKGVFIAFNIFFAVSRDVQNRLKWRLFVLGVQELKVRSAPERVSVYSRVGKVSVKLRTVGKNGRSCVFASLNGLNRL